MRLEIPNCPELCPALPRPLIFGLFDFHRSTEGRPGIFPPLRHGLGIKTKHPGVDEDERGVNSQRCPGARWDGPWGAEGENSLLQIPRSRFPAAEKGPERSRSAPNLGLRSVRGQGVRRAQGARQRFGAELSVPPKPPPVLVPSIQPGALAGTKIFAVPEWKRDPVSPKSAGGGFQPWGRTASFWFNPMEASGF